MFKLVVFIILIANSYGNPKIFPKQSNGRIVGGEVTTIEKYPYTVSVQNTGQHVCGGVLVSEDTVVTLASYLDGVSLIHVWSVRAGTSEAEYDGVSINFTIFHIHPDYNLNNLDYDIGIIKLDYPFTLSESIQLIPLLTEEPEDGAIAQLTGYGVTSEEDWREGTLRVVDIPIVNRATCNIAFFGHITPRMICAGGDGKDFCMGDEGSPLAVNGKLAGIASLRYGCARPTFFGIYSNIAVLHPFITEHL